MQYIYYLFLITYLFILNCLHKHILKDKKIKILLVAGYNIAFSHKPRLE